MMEFLLFGVSLAIFFILYGIFMAIFKLLKKQSRRPIWNLGLILAVLLATVIIISIVFLHKYDWTTCGLLPVTIVFTLVGAFRGDKKTKHDS
jgi:predicted tellurium resistance membrane protein TerC